jgi:hypothetical protein
LDATAQAAQETTHMLADLALALVFLAMIIAPAIITMPSERDERDSL